MVNEFKKVFWDKKILSWEEKSYARKNNFLKKDLKVRMNYFVETLKKQKNLRVLELGCGSGILFEKIKDHVESYIGVDFSETAINKFKSENAECTLLNLTIEDVSYEELNYDIVVSSGFIDWLNESQIESLIKICRGKKFIHSFSNKSSIMSLIHRIYIMLKYGYKNKSYTPKYFTEQEIKTLFLEHRESKVKRLSTLVSVVSRL